MVVIDPSDDNPVGFNPLALPGNPTLIADAILAVFKEIFSDSWGVRSQDVLLSLIHIFLQVLDCSDLTVTESSNIQLGKVLHIVTDSIWCI